MVGVTVKFLRAPLSVRPTFGTVATWPMAINVGPLDPSSESNTFGGLDFIGEDIARLIVSICVRILE